MTSCDRCGSSNDDIQTCSECGGSYCTSHIMSSSHVCFEDGRQDKEESPDSLADSWVDPAEDKHGDTPFSLSVGRDSFSLTEETGSETRRGRLGSMLRGNVTYVFLALMGLTTMLQHIVFPLVGIPSTDPTWRAVFVLQASNIEFVWTWVTSIFSHSGLMHLLLNSIVIFFFGRIVEEKLGTKKYVAFFIGSGILAGLAQVAVGAATGGVAAVIGASGAGLAVLGFVTLIRPNQTIYLMFVIPAPLWVVTALFTLASISGFVAGGAGAGGIAQVAHLVGLIVGLATVYYHMDGNVRYPSLNF